MNQRLFQMYNTHLFAKGTGFGIIRFLTICIAVDFC